MAKRKIIGKIEGALFELRPCKLATPARYLRIPLAENVLDDLFQLFMKNGGVIHAV